jgi:SAM-dependent methyltransferase
MTQDSRLLDRSMRAVFPPAPLMQRVSGLTSNEDFAAHGRDIFAGLEVASPKPLLEFESILDFGIGSGRLARMFHDFTGSYTGVDVDRELVEWINGSLPWVNAIATIAKDPLPFPDASFDCVISISVFTHMNEVDSKFYLQELYRVTKPGAVLFLTVSGTRVIQRALTEQTVEDMLAISHDAILEASARLNDPADGFCFAHQKSHLATDTYDYGATFVSENYIYREWSKLFSVYSVVRGGIHDFQDIAVVGR